MTVGKKIRKFRLEKDITQKILSERTGIAEITIRQYEAEKYNPKMNNLALIAHALDIPLSELINVPNKSDMYDVITQISSATIENIDGKERIRLLNINELHNFFLLNEIGKKKALSYIEDLSKLQEYTEDKPPTIE